MALESGMSGVFGTNAMMHTKPIASALLFLLTLPGAQAALPASTVFAGQRQFDRKSLSGPPGSWPGV